MVDFAKKWGPQIVIGVFFFVFLAGCGKKTHGQQGASSALSPTQTDTMSTFTLIGNAPDGRKKWQVNGENAQMDGDLVALSPVTAVNFGQVDVHLTAKNGRYHRETQDVHLERDVVVTTTDGATMTTDSLDWVAQRDKGTTSDWVTVTRAGMTAVGQGAVGYPKLKRVRLEHQVTVTLEGKNGKTVITCDGPLEVDYNRSKGRFWRNVQVKDHNGWIQSDRLDVELEPSTRQLQKASFWGHVKIHQENKLSFCNRAIYWQSPSRTLLIGHPKLVMRPENRELENLS